MLAGIKGEGLGGWPLVLTAHDHGRADESHGSWAGSLTECRAISRWVWTGSSTRQSDSPSGEAEKLPSRGGSSGDRGCAYRCRMVSSTGSWSEAWRPVPAVPGAGAPKSTLMWTGGSRRPAEPGPGRPARSRGPEPVRGRWLRVPNIMKHVCVAAKIGADAKGGAEHIANMVKPADKVSCAGRSRFQALLCLDATPQQDSSTP